MNYRRYLVSLILPLALCIQNTKAQSTNTGSSSEDATKGQSNTVGSVNDTTTDLTEINENLKELKEKLTAIEKNIEKQSLGTLAMETEAITVYRDKEPSRIQLKIDSIILIIEEGFINDIQVISGKWRFTNGQAPIGLYSSRFAKTDKLIGKSPSDGKDYSIKLQRVLFYTLLRPYAPDDTTIILTRQNPVQEYFKGVNLYSILDLRLYTDAFGLFNESANGLLQLDARAKWFIHQSNVNNTHKFIARYIKTNINFSRFDNDNKYIDSISHSRSALLQKSWFNGEFAIGAFEWGIKKKTNSRFYIDLGFQLSAASFQSSTIATTSDTTINVDDNGVETKTINNTIDTNVTSKTFVVPNLFIETGINIKSSDNFGLNLSLRGLFNYSFQSKGINGDNSSSHFFLRPSFEAYYNPFGDRSGRVFARFNYWLDTKTLADKQQHFFQMQIGYTTTLSKINKK